MSKGFLEEFRSFAIKGNVIDLAVGVIIGGAFAKITNSLVSDIFMPPLGLLISGINFKQIKIYLKPAILDGSGKVVSEAVTLQVGNLIQSIFEFTLMAIAIFLLVKLLSRLHMHEDAKPKEPEAPKPEVILLSEIRDLLAAQPQVGAALGKESLDLISPPDAKT